MKLKGNNTLQGMLCVLCAGMCWGTTGTIQAYAPAEAASLTIGAARVIFSGIILMAFALARKGRSLFDDGWSKMGVFWAAFGLAAYQLTFFSAVRLTGVAVGTMVAIGAAPPVAGAFGYVFFKERLSWRWLISTILAVAGCSLLIIGGGGSLEVGALGVLLAFCAAFSYALEGVGLRLIKNKDPYDVIALVSAVSGLMALPWIGDISWMASPRGAFCITMLTIFSTILPYTLFTIGIAKISLGTAYTLGLSEPLTAWFLSAVLLGESLSVIGLTGVAMLFGGILLLALNKKG